MSAVIVSTKWIIFQIDDLTANVALAFVCTQVRVRRPSCMCVCVSALCEFRINKIARSIVNLKEKPTTYAAKNKKIETYRRTARIKSSQPSRRAVLPPFALLFPFFVVPP